MKLRFAIIALLCVAGISLDAGAENKWVGGDTHDFGAFDENTGVVYCEFKMVNEGTEPMSITGARANCGCTKPIFSTDPVAPGDTAVVRVGYDPTGRPGRFSKRVYVDFSAEPTRTVVTITGTVIGSSNTLKSRYPIEVGPVRMRTGTIAYGKLRKGETMGQYIDAYNASTDTLRPRVENAPKYINVIVQPAVVPPGEQFILSTILHSDGTPQWGVVTDSLVFYPDAKATKGQKVETVVILEEDFSKLTPAQLANAPMIDTETSIDLGQLSRGKSAFRMPLEIRNTGKSPLVIRAISCPDAAVKVTLKDMTIKPGKSAKAEVTVDPALVKSRELLNARINIIANDPAHPSTMVRVVAEMTE